MALAAMASLQLDLCYPGVFVILAIVTHQVLVAFIPLVGECWLGYLVIPGQFSLTSVLWDDVGSIVGMLRSFVLFIQPFTGI